MVIFPSRTPDYGREVVDITNNHAASCVLYIALNVEQHTAVHAKHCVYFSAIKFSLGFYTTELPLNDSSWVYCLQGVQSPSKFRVACDHWWKSNPPNPPASCPPKLIGTCSWTRGWWANATGARTFLGAEAGWVAWPDFMTSALNPLCLSEVYLTVRVVPSGSTRLYWPLTTSPSRCSDCSLMSPVCWSFTPYLNSYFGCACEQWNTYKFYYSPTNAQVIVLKTILKFTLK